MKTGKFILISVALLLIAVLVSSAVRNVSVEDSETADGSSVSVGNGADWNDGTIIIPDLFLPTDTSELTSEAVQELSLEDMSYATYETSDGTYYYGLRTFELKANTTYEVTWSIDSMSSPSHVSYFFDDVYYGVSYSIVGDGTSVSDTATYEPSHFFDNSGKPLTFTTGESVYETFLYFFYGDSAETDVGVRELYEQTFLYFMIKEVA